MFKSTSWFHREHDWFPNASWARGEVIVLIDGEQDNGGLGVDHILNGFFPDKWVGGFTLACLLDALG
jgi:hypothetical protein